MDEKTIYVLIGSSMAKRRFDEFYRQSIALAKAGVLTKVNKKNLLLGTKHFSIRFVPNTNIDLLRGIRCTWAYGFGPDSTRYLEFRVSEEMKELKPLVEDTDELMQRIAEMEKRWID